ncbi:hypothetical protein PAPHI01_0848 [Pancytospora philotis]|nr:hypothetical protein PAPHI01_0848 [Pancytospora philotis]
MDELLSQLRSSKGRLPSCRKDDEREIKRACRALGQQGEAASPAEQSDDGAGDADLELTTSQIDKQLSAFQLNFEQLAQAREAECALLRAAASKKAPVDSSSEEEYITAAEIRRLPLYRIDRPFYAILKSVECYGADVCRWELCDETGVVFGSTCAREEAAAIGDVVCLSRCSLWKIKENHLNIAQSNIVKVIRRGQR